MALLVLIEWSFNQYFYCYNLNICLIYVSSFSFSRIIILTGYEALLRNIKVYSSYWPPCMICLDLFSKFRIVLAFFKVNSFSEYPAADRE